MHVTALKSLQCIPLTPPSLKGILNRGFPRVHLRTYKGHTPRGVRGVLPPWALKLLQLFPPAGSRSGWTPNLSAP